jgi:hypothetical protein
MRAHYLKRREFIALVGSATACCVAADAHAVLVLDKVDWHTTHQFEIPANISLLHLPPASPDSGSRPSPSLQAR